MASATFDHALPTAFVAALREEARREGWWRDVLQDPSLVIATRGRSLNVYWHGQALFTVTCPHGALRVTTHEKFLLDPALAGQVPLRADGTFDTAALLERALVDRYKGPTTLAKLKTAAALFAGDEKRGCHEIAVRNAAVIDVEVAFPGRHTVGAHTYTAPRVDLAAVEADGSDARLVFWEAKTYANGELRALGDEPAPVCRQVEAYRFVLAAQRQIVEASFAGVAANLVAFKAMGWARPLSPLIEAVGAGEARLHLGAEPQVGLVVFGFDAGQREEERWIKHRAKLEQHIPTVRFIGDATKIRL
ncbi:hypothetical protein SAMN04488144_13224 [Methylobacterium sp. 190mf]|uniref:hypothetical protein n=1 Tax=Methylobacterium sp. 190mf TaxID=1761798 RepID=UPI00089E85AF|nr:hypothetical protein [Methylobacterium sp. 190mf]SEG64448.1 hypothetical protein SAMN04488144_13224 [Methylobacterium sp. 190mf]